MKPLWQISVPWVGSSETADHEVAVRSPLWAIGRMWVGLTAELDRKMKGLFAKSITESLVSDSKLTDLFEGPRIMDRHGKPYERTSKAPKDGRYVEMPHCFTVVRT